MEYYDSMSNPQLYLHFSQKNIGMLTNPEVTSVLDLAEKNKQLGSKINLFNNDTPYKIVSHSLRRLNTMPDGDGRDDISQCESTYQSGYLNTHTNGCQIYEEEQPNIEDYTRAKILSRDSNVNGLDRIQRKTFHDNVKKGVQKEMNKLDDKLNQVENIVNQDMDTQKLSFEERKKRKQERMKMKQRRSLRFQVRRGSKLDDILIAVGNFYIKNIFSRSGP